MTGPTTLARPESSIHVEDAMQAILRIIEGLEGRDSLRAEDRDLLILARLAREALRPAEAGSQQGGA